VTCERDDLLGENGDSPKTDGIEEGAPLYGGMVAGITDGIGVAVFPGQSAKEVLKIAEVLERELDVGQATSQYVARRILLALRV
jgi:hypothetical protein